MPLVLDHFTDADGTNLTAHTPDVRPGSNLWSVLSGTFDIHTNQARCTGTNGGNNHATIDSTASDCIVRALVTPQSAPAYGLVVRQSDDSNGWLAALANNVNQIKIYELVAGVFTLRASASFTVSTGTQYTVRVVAAGQSISMDINNNAASASYASAASNQSVTKHGLNFDTSWTADDFQMDPILLPRVLVQPCYDPIDVDEW